MISKTFYSCRPVLRFRYNASHDHYTPIRTAAIKAFA
jgi:hypothetical protein